jgi:hypothetical protein
MIDRALMGRLALVSLALRLISGVSLSTVDLPDSWRSWRFSRTIQISEPIGLSKINVPVNLYANLDSESADLRIVDDAGKEIPFLLYDKSIRAPMERRLATIRENSFVPGQYTQLLIDTGEKIAFHNALEIHTSQIDFIDWVEVAASDDARTWRIVKDRAPISSFRKENIEGSRVVFYSDNNARFVRMRIFEADRQFPVSSIDILFSREFHGPVRTSLPSQFIPDSTAPATASRWIADLGPASFPVSGVAIETSEPNFFRIVHMETSEDGKQWQSYFSGEIYRYKQGNKEAESLGVFSGESWHQRFWRIEIMNGDDAPLAGAKPTLLATPYFVLFYPQSGHSYRLIYGNAAAKLPQYDLSRTFDYHAEPNAKVATLGEEKATANYLDPRPFSERHANLLWIALVIAAVLLGYTAFRALRVPTTETS